nr:3'-5' exonuclease [Aestuariivivens sediminicola]
MSFLTNRGFIVSGGPGTGKTLIAKELAVRKNLEGSTVAYFCFNKNLSAEVYRYFRNTEGISVNVFYVHGFIYEHLSKASLIPNGDRQSDEYWREQLPAQFKMWHNSLNISQYDYLIIDEGQDIFTENIIDAIFCSLKGGIESGNWSIFIDYKYQGFYEGFDEDYFKLFVGTYPCSMSNLPLNCRNHDDIVKVASRHSGFEMMPCRRTNIPFKTKTSFYSSLNNLYKEIERICGEWIKDEIDCSDITILTTENELISKIMQNVGFGFHRVDEVSHKVKGKVTISTIHGYKGLENDFIIVAGIENYFPDEKENMSLLYVGYTRARLGLAICFSEDNKIKLAIKAMD